MYATMIRKGTSNRLIDVRSDTVTRPSAGMRQFMSEAEVGDDVYGDDPTVRMLEERVADLVGKEQGLFVASGTQSNLIALLSHCGRGDEYISGVGYHIAKYEAAGAAVLAGISPRHITPDETGGLKPEEVLAAVQPDDPHFAVSKLVCMENTFNGKVQDQANVEAVSSIAREQGLKVHLDGARLMNASIASQTSVAELASSMDSVSFCLSKGLGAPVGSVLCGSGEFIHKARRNRKLVGGGMRQSGVLAACGLYALEHNVDRLADDHRNAAELARHLDSIDGISIELDHLHTNMIWMRVDKNGPQPLSEFMLTKGFVMSDPDPQLRLVCHLDFDQSNIAPLVEAFREWAD